MLKNKNASLNRRQKNLKYITQIVRVLENLKQEGIVKSFKETSNQAFKLLEYRVFFLKDKFFYLQIMPASFHPRGGVELGEYIGPRIILLVDSNPFQIIRKRIQEILKDCILEKEKGFILEDQFYLAIKKLIARDSQFRAMVTDVIPSSDNDDILEKIDFFLITPFGKVPIQIKSGRISQKKHIDGHRTKVPSIVFSSSFNLDILKNQIFKIIQSYLKGIVEHM